MNKLYSFVDTVVKNWHKMSEEQKNEFCEALSTGNFISIIKILKEMENENKTN